MLHRCHRRPLDLDMNKIDADKSKMGGARIEWLAQLATVEGAG